MQDRPTAAELLDATRDFVQGEVAAAVEERRLRFRALIAANLLAIVEREEALGHGQLAAEQVRLMELLGHRRPTDPVPRSEQLGAEVAALSAELCRRIRSGEFDTPGRFEPALAHCRSTVEEKLAIANPKYLAKFGSNGAAEAEPGGGGGGGGAS